MTYRENTQHRNYLFVRCPFCRDSQKRDYVGHLSINIQSGSYYCFRCYISGKLSPQEHLELLNSYQANIELSMVDMDELPTLSGNQLFDSRPTVLDHSYEPPFRVYQMRLPNGHVTGYYYRHTEYKYSTIKGHLGYGFFGDAIEHSSIRVVEGPYDAVYENDVCLFGSLSGIKFKHLYPYEITLAPDGDILADRYRRANFRYTVKSLLKKGYSIVRIEEYPQDIDPHIAFTMNIRPVIIDPNRFILERD